MSFDENNFEKLRFDSFGSDKIILNNRLSLLRCFALKKQQQVLKN